MNIKSETSLELPLTAVSGGQDKLHEVTKGLWQTAGGFLFFFNISGFSQSLFLMCYIFTNIVKGER